MGSSPVKQSSDMKMKEDSVGSHSFFNYSEPRNEESDKRRKESEEIIPEVINEENKE